MKSHQQTLSGEWHLDASSTVSWVAPSAARVQVGKGSVWITRVDQAEDIVLRAGESLPVRAGDRIVMGLLALRASADLAWQAAEEGAQPSVWQQRGARWQRHAAQALRAARLAVRRLSLTEQEALPV